MPEIKLTDSMVREFMRNGGLFGELAAEVMARREQVAVLEKIEGHFCECAKCRKQLHKVGLMGAES